MKMHSRSKGTALVTGASSGIGAIYADRLAHRGHDLILAARNQQRLDTLAERLTSDTGNCIEAFVADLNDGKDLGRVEQLLRTNPQITMLVNNAGVAAVTPFLETDVDEIEEMIRLNVRALTRLTFAAVPRSVARGGGTIVNIASVVGIAPELLNGVYGGTKAFVIALSLSLHEELADRNVRVQVVLPGATATDLWEKAGKPVEQLPNEIVMRADDLVDAALVGLDKGEIITIPSLPDAADWDAYEAARQKLIPNLSHKVPAARYRARPRYHREAPIPYS